MVEQVTTRETSSHRTRHPLEVLNYFLGTNGYFESVFPMENVSALSMSSAESQGRHHHIAYTGNGLVSFSSEGLMSFPSTISVGVGSRFIPNVINFLLEYLLLFTVVHCACSLACPGIHRALGLPWVQSPEQGSVLMGWLTCPSPPLTWERGETSFQVYGDSGVGKCVCFKVWEVRRTCLLLTTLIQAGLGFPSAKDFSGSCLMNN